MLIHLQKSDLPKYFLTDSPTYLSFLCVICAICERITRKSTQVIAQLKTQCLSQIYADKTQNHNNIPTCLSLRNMQPAAFLCVICVICGRITRKSTQSIGTNKNPVSHANLADLRRRNSKWG